MKAHCKRDITETESEGWPRVPRNGVLIIPGKTPVVVVDGTVMSMDMKNIIAGGLGKTYTFPGSVTAVRKEAFKRR